MADDPAPQLLRIAGELFKLFFLEGSPQTGSPPGQLFGVDARGEDTGDVDLFRQGALFWCRSHVLLQNIGAKVGHILDGQDVQQLCAQLHLVGSRSAL